jgi:hypothetical protein
VAAPRYRATIRQLAQSDVRLEERTGRISTRRRVACYAGFWSSNGKKPGMGVKRKRAVKKAKKTNGKR